MRTYEEPPIPYEGSREGHSARTLVLESVDSLVMAPMVIVELLAKFPFVGARGLKKFPRRNLTELKFPKRNNRDFGNIIIKRTQ